MSTNVVTTLCLCDECGQDFPQEQLRICKLNGDDEPRKVCKTCCQGCGYSVEGECCYF